MNCSETTELLAAAVLGDLSRDEQRSVHAHLARCDRCLEVEDELFESMRLVRAYGEIEPGAGLHAAVMDRAAGAAAEPGIPQSIRHHPMGLLTQTLLTAAATVLIVVGLQAVMESWRQSPAPAPHETAVYGSSPAGQDERPAPSLLEGTLFDRQRNIPDDLRQLRQQLRRGDASLPLDL